MIQQIEQIQIELLQQLEGALVHENLIHRYEHAVKIASDSLRIVRDLLYNTKITDTLALVKIHKELIPAIYAEYVYYACLHNLELDKPVSSGLKEYYEKIQYGIESFFGSHADFLKYYRSGKTYMDDSYFAGKSSKEDMAISLYTPMIENAFCSTWSFLAAQSIAYQRLLNEILAVLNKLDGNSFKETVEPCDLQWTASKTDLIELVYAFHATGVFNNSKTSIADIVRFIEQAFGLSLGNTSMTFQEILRRKDSTVFLNKLKDKLELHITRIEEKLR